MKVTPSAGMTLSLSPHMHAHTHVHTHPVAGQPSVNTAVESLAELFGL